MLDRLRERRGEQHEALLATTDAPPGVVLEGTIAVVGAEAGDEGGALRALARRGAEVGADAVVGVRVVSTATGGLFLATRSAFAYGTAVRGRRLS